jgi:hypothetical protein
VPSGAQSSLGQAGFDKAAGHAAPEPVSSFLFTSPLLVAAKAGTTERTSTQAHTQYGGQTLPAAPCRRQPEGSPGNQKGYLALPARHETGWGTWQGAFMRRLYMPGRAGADFLRPAGAHGLGFFVCKTVQQRDKRRKKVVRYARACRGAGGQILTLDRRDQTSDPISS